MSVLDILFIIFGFICLIGLFFFSIPLLFQVFSCLVAYIMPMKKFKTADKKVKFAFIIPAHNEEDVIYDTIKNILEGQDYPKELISVYVVADNCTDSTAKLAKDANAFVIINNDDDPLHHMARYPIKKGIDYILENDVEAELIVHADADNHFSSNFCQKMNDAYLTKGYDFLRPYEGALNGMQNFYTKACSFFYAFDSRISSRSREWLNLGQHVQGSGATMSRRMLLKCNGYDSQSISDDADFYLRRLNEGIKAHYVEEAVVYEDMPSTKKDTLNRNKRIKQGTIELFKDQIKKMPKKFFKTRDFSYLEVPLSYCWIFIGKYFFIYLILPILMLTFTIFGSLNMIPYLNYFNPMFFKDLLWLLLNVSVVILISLFVLFFVGILLTMIIHDYKNFGAKKRREMIPLLFSLLFYLIAYAFSLSTPKKEENNWEKVQRNPIKKE